MEKKFTGALIVAAGKGVRSKSTIPKQYIHFGHKTFLQKNIENFIYEPLIDFVIVAINKEHVELYEKAIAKIHSSKLLPKCFGGDTRSKSVKNGLKAIANIGCSKILIQDGARPFTSNNIIKNCINGLDKFDVVFLELKFQILFIFKRQKIIEKQSINWVLLVTTLSEHKLLKPFTLTIFIKNI